VAFVRGRSKDIRQAMLAMPLSNELQGRYAAMADASVVEQKTAEDSDEVDFDHYLQNYLSAASA
jgi:glutamate--cysteine ligase